MRCFSYLKWCGRLSWEQLFPIKNYEHIRKGKEHFQTWHQLPPLSSINFNSCNNFICNLTKLQQICSTDWKISDISCLLEVVLGHVASNPKLCIGASLGKHIQKEKWGRIQKRANRTLKKEVFNGYETWKKRKRQRLVSYGNEVGSSRKKRGKNKCVKSLTCVLVEGGSKLTLDGNNNCGYL